MNKEQSLLLLKKLENQIDKMSEEEKKDFIEDAKIFFDDKYENNYEHSKFEIQFEKYSEEKVKKYSTKNNFISNNEMKKFNVNWLRVA